MCSPSAYNRGKKPINALKVGSKLKNPYQKPHVGDKSELQKIYAISQQKEYINKQSTLTSSLATVLTYVRFCQLKTLPDLRILVVDNMRKNIRVTSLNSKTIYCAYRFLHDYRKKLIFNTNLSTWVESLTTMGIYFGATV